MAIRFYGKRFLRSTEPDRPPIPAGWRFESRGYELVAIAPSGDEFFVEVLPEKFVLIPRLIANTADVERTQGRLKLGEVFAGTNCEQFEYPRYLEKSTEE